MSRCLLCIASAVVLAAPIRADEKLPAVSFKEADGRIHALVGGAEFATYVFNDPDIPRPYFCQVRVPGGPQVTRTHPPVKGTDASDHDRFHPGVWLAFGDLSGHDSWRLQAKVRHDKFTAEPAGGAGAGSFAVANSYLKTDGKGVIAREACKFDVRVRPSGVLLVWDSSFTRGDADCVFGDQEEMGLGVRMATPLTVKAGGEIRNSAGAVNEKGVWGKQADWCDYGGVIDGNRVGMVVMPDPGNFRRSWFHARDYGFVAANPFGRQAFTKSAPSRVAVVEGKPLRLRFGVLVYSKAGKDPLDAGAAYRDFLGVIGAKN